MNDKDSRFATYLTFGDMCICMFWMDFTDVSNGCYVCIVIF